jgi:hypothetical protein
MSGFTLRPFFASSWYIQACSVDLEVRSPQVRPELNTLPTEPK